jgi:hypothetical protein
MKMESYPHAKTEGYGRLDALIVTTLCGVGLLLLLAFTASLVKHRSGGAPAPSSFHQDGKQRSPVH